MGYGDDIMATGMARGAKRRGKRIAFGDGRRIIWGPWSEEMFRHNPNIAPPGSEGASDIEWVDYYKGHRKYNSQGNGKWIWNMDYRPVPGQFFFDEGETSIAREVGATKCILIEPNVPQQKSVAPNKQWPIERFQMVADRLKEQGLTVLQFIYPGAKYRLDGVVTFEPVNFRVALAVMGTTRLYIGPEGGMHHGAAALIVPGVVIFGGFIPPEVTGYDIHTNLTGDVGEGACGSLTACSHCREALNSITVKDVLRSVDNHLSTKVQ